MTETTYQSVQTNPVVINDTHHDRVHFDANYLKTPSGLLKMVQIALGLIVFICATVAIRSHPVFYGCAVWASVIGFVSMILTAASLLLHSLHVPSTVTSVPWRTIDMGYAALWAGCFLIAGVTLTIVADAAVTREYYKSIYRVDSLDDLQAYALAHMTQETPGQSKPMYYVQTLTAKFDEYRAATTGAVFAFVASLVYAADTFHKNKERRRSHALHKRNKNGPAAV